MLLQLNYVRFETGLAVTVDVEGPNPEHVSAAGLQPPDHVAEGVALLHVRGPDVAAHHRVLHRVTVHDLTPVVGGAAPSHGDAVQVGRDAGRAAGGVRGP